MESSKEKKQSKEDTSQIPLKAWSETSIPMIKIKRRRFVMGDQICVNQRSLSFEPTQMYGAVGRFLNYCEDARYCKVDFGFGTESILSTDLELYSLNQTKNT